MFGIDDLIGAGISAVSGLIGAADSSGDRRKALEANHQALQAWLNVNVPDPEKQKIFLQNYVNTGKLTPEVEQAYSQGKSQLNGIQVDPGLKSKQLNALDSLSDISKNGGMNLSDQANEQKRVNDINAMDRGKRGAIADSFAARGMGGSGLEMASQLGEAQDATNRANEASLNTTASARQRALDSIMGSGQLAGNMRNQDFGEQKDVAGAQDAINRYNTTNLQSVAQRNTNRQTEANQYNVQNAQDIANRNTGVANQQEIHNKGLYQQNFDNQKSLAGGVANAQNGMANAYSGAADRTAGQWAGAGSAIDHGITAAQNRSAYIDAHANKVPDPNAGTTDIRSPDRKKSDDDWYNLMTQ